MEKLPLFEDVVLEASFESESGFFKHARRCGVIRERLCINSPQLKVFEAEIGEGCDSFAHDAAPPELLAQPVTQLSGLPMHVSSDANANPTNGVAINLNTKQRRRLGINY